ncbi:amidohydrolase family protein [Chelativorans sp. M5D2P16]|uniref:metal-dependent hydrolase family protein n=1 Tax=Chelativorans sp. M5D2P16 TaxID=3095678 RepID=UPI002ACA8263|nr:amidohydrolase family protein [Chelativorans sp. M5D2P16]MDZ5699986.1 amidohydrolase family protein [Chelativorans sp. M5D2P16]
MYLSGPHTPSGFFCEEATAVSNTPCACCSPQARALSERLGTDLKRRMFVLGGVAAVVAPFMEMRSAHALGEQPAAPERPLLFTNLRLFDGVNQTVREGVNILVRGNRIDALPGAAESVEDAEVVDCGGRLAMPGLIDAHWHSTMCAISELEAFTAQTAYLHLVAAREAERTLMRGFTTVRDAGGPAFALKTAIDRGIINGPRIYPSGSIVSQTSGHGDFRFPNELPRGNTTPRSYAEVAGMSSLADGEAEVLQSVRENLMLGATQIKLAAGGGVSSFFDPIDSTQFLEEELRAAVRAAEDWGTYVTVHVYVPRGIQRAIRAGVKCIEHGQLADEETARMIADEGIWWSLQPFLADEDANVKPTPEQRAQQEEISKGTVRVYGELLKKFDIKSAWGTDILFGPQQLPNHGRQIAKLTRFYDPLELLSIVTGNNGELCRMCGPRNPYDGNLGVIEPGALADLLIAEGDPTQDLDFLMDPEENLKVIVKDGRIHKNTLA